ncbi:hypothetical protein DFH08DRAFT_796929 [Mycena albidolilacea]|uniref:Uncharacterized protein n=1 Tax=Mycena albidolilacea TaxID=1033008 RepID=A0AAD7AW62_9AGAR|nr:hypothetical protein DFH08DRAFT_796929 [Mycena albidolilacea]
MCDVLCSIWMELGAAIKNYARISDQDDGIDAVSYLRTAVCADVALVSPRNLHRFASFGALSHPYARCNDLREMHFARRAFVAGLDPLIWAIREGAQPPSDKPALQGILLDDVTYRLAPCDKCGISGPPSQHLCAPPGEPLQVANPERDIPKLISDLYIRPQYEHWDASDAVCNTCFTKFVSAHLHQRLLDHRLKVSGTLYGCEAPKDCWYGYKCQTQIEVTLYAMPMKNNQDPSYGCLSLADLRKGAESIMSCENEPRAAPDVGLFPTITSTIGSLSSILDWICYTVHPGQHQPTQLKNGDSR